MGARVAIACEREYPPSPISIDPIHRPDRHSCTRHRVQPSRHGECRNGGRLATSVRFARVRTPKNDTERAAACTAGRARAVCRPARSGRANGNQLLVWRGRSRQRPAHRAAVGGGGTGHVLARRDRGEPAVRAAGECSLNWMNRDVELTFIRRIPPGGDSVTATYIVGVSGRHDPTAYGA